MLLLAGFAGGGGLLAAKLGLPVPYLFGSALISAALSMAGWGPERFPTRVSVAARVAIGTLIGASIDVGFLDRVGEFVVAALLVPVQMALALTAGGLYLRACTRMTASERCLGSLPGGLATVALSVDAIGHDFRRISLYHAIRMLTTVVSVPLLLAWGLSLDIAGMPDGVRLRDLDGLEALTLLGVGSVGWIGARFLRTPVAPLLFPLALATTASMLLGLPEAPQEATAAVQVALGMIIGARFGVGEFRDFRNALWTGFLLTAILLLASLLPVLALQRLTEMPLSTAILAFAPGGVAEFSLLALALDQDPALVLAVHSWRILLVLLALPWLLRWMQREDSAFGEAANHTPNTVAPGASGSPRDAAGLDDGRPLDERGASGRGGRG